MAIRPPYITLSDEERRLITLLEKLIYVAITDQWQSENISAPSNSEIDELFLLIQHLAESRRFRENTYLAENLHLDTTAQAEQAMKRIYITAAGAKSARNPFAPRHWADFTTRLGHPRDLTSYATETSPMTYEHFLKMEKTLFDQFELRPSVSRLLLKLVAEHQDRVEETRRAKQELPSNFVLNLISDLPDSIRRFSLTHWLDQPMETNRAAGLLTIVINLSALYSSRDWSVASVLSTLAGAMTVAVGKS